MAFEKDIREYELLREPMSRMRDEMEQKKRNTQAFKMFLF